MRNLKQRAKDTVNNFDLLSYAHDYIPVGASCNNVTHGVESSLLVQSSMSAREGGHSVSP